jgi:LysM repeat protein
MFGNRTNARRSSLTRSLAATLGVVLLFGSAIPPFALAESDREGIGAAPPGAVPPGLEEGPGFEPGGEETSLEEVPIAPGEEVAEEVVPPAPEEVESPSPVPEAPSPVVAVPSVTPEVGSPAAVPEPASAPEPSAPVYGTEASAPTYEPSVAAAPVENEPIVAPGSSGQTTHGSEPAPQKAADPSPIVETPPAEEPAPAPTESPEPIASPVATGDRAGTLRGRATYTVVPGDCLSWIAERALPAGATDAEISAEVARLWRLNAQTIGTGDPNLILVGTVLRLH